MRARVFLATLLLGMLAGLSAVSAQGLTGEAKDAYLREKYRKMGDHYYSIAAYQTAYDYYTRIPGVESADPETLYRMGYSALQGRKREEAPGWFEKAAAVYSERTASPKAELDDYYHLASCRSFLKDEEGMTAVAREGVDKYLKKAEKGKLGGADYFRMSRLYTFLRQTDLSEAMIDRSVAAYRDAGEVDPEDIYLATVFMAQARRNVATGNYGQAIEVYQELLKYRPRNPGTTWELGLAQLRNGDRVGAQKSWDRARTMDPARSSEAGYASNLLLRILQYQQAYPEAGEVDIEAAYSRENRARLEQLISVKVSEVRMALESLRAATAAGGPPGEAAIESNPVQIQADAAQADLAAALLAYTIRGLPIREVANGHGLVGWIFAPSRQ